MMGMTPSAANVAARTAGVGIQRCGGHAADERSVVVRLHLRRSDSRTSMEE
jgi:hypothetical protein